jgi:hypothetical protein
MSSTHIAGPAGAGINASKFSSLPTTKLGRWAMWLAVAFIVMFAMNSVFVGVFGTTTNPAMNAFSRTVMPFYGIGMLLVGAAAGVVGLVSIIKDHERSWVVWVTLLPMAFVLFFVIGEFAMPH